MNEILLNSEELVKLKNEAGKYQREICRQLSKETDLSMNTLYKYKDYLYYYGRGWTETSISKPDPEEKFKDRISPVFRHLLDIINTCCAVNHRELLDQYLEDMKDAGVTIIIDEEKVNNSFDKKTLNIAIEEMKTYQKIICEKADELKELGDPAEQERLCKAGRFKRLAEEHYRLKYDNERRVEKLKLKMTKEINDNMLNNNGIEYTKENSNA